jgi:hypothetical protein
VKTLRLDEIRPSPFQPRESFPREEIQQLARTIRDVGLLQPISVRKKGKTYQIISGERRWRACQFAKLNEIPAIIKEVTDSQMMAESLIENVQRKDLEPLERARGLAEVYKLVGFEPTKVGSQLRMIEQVVNGRVNRQLSKEEHKIKEIADTIGLSYDYQYRLLTQLRLTPEEQRRVSELGLGYEETATIATIEEPEIRSRLIEIAPELRRAEVKKISKLVKKAPKSVVKAILDRKVTPDVAEEIVKIEKPQAMNEALRIAEKGVYTPEGMRTRIDQLLKPRIDLPTQTLETQIFNKAMWNLARVGKFDFYTIGYEKRTIEQFVGLLKAAKVATLWDVRKNPISQYKPEFNKEALKETVTKNDIGYAHRQELGVPTETRRKLEETQDYDWFFKEYDAKILHNLDKIDLKAYASPIAMMCVEFDPTRCHRHRIALALEKKGLKGYDL